ncbi:hypothetical protein WMF30_39995 [Sorangium sp. So ce134]
MLTPSDAARPPDEAPPALLDAILASLLLKLDPDRAGVPVISICDELRSLSVHAVRVMLLDAAARDVVVLEPPERPIRVRLLKQNAAPAGLDATPNAVRIQALENAVLQALACLKRGDVELAMATLRGAVKA